MNTGDDETFFGLHISPDLDTITYTLANLADRNHGWGIDGDSFHCLESLSRLYDESWFQLGDRDLATHLYRTDALRRGATLSQATSHLAASLGVRQHILPMTNDEVRTFIRTERGRLPFQVYLVRERARGRVRGVHFRGIERARPAPGVLDAIRRADCILLPPSNPFVSIGPILGLAGVRSALRRRRRRVAAISPIVGGVPIKGPAHRMLKGLGHDVSPLGVARLYADIASVFILDHCDARYAGAIAQLGLRPIVTDTVMTSPARSRALAARALAALLQ